MVFYKKSYTFDVLFNIKDEMLDLKQLTVEVCRIATEAGHFLKEERKKFHRERVIEKHAHDWSKLSLPCCPRLGLLRKKVLPPIRTNPIVG